MSLLGGLIGGVVNGIFGSRSQKKAQEAANQSTAQQAQAARYAADKAAESHKANLDFQKKLYEESKAYGYGGNMAANKARQQMTDLLGLGSDWDAPGTHPLAPPSFAFMPGTEGFFPAEDGGGAQNPAPGSGGSGPGNGMVGGDLPSYNPGTTVYGRDRGGPGGTREGSRDRGYYESGFIGGGDSSRGDDYEGLIF